MVDKPWTNIVRGQIVDIIWMWTNIGHSLDFVLKVENSNEK